MELTLKERLQLILMLKILEKVDEEKKEDYEYSREILEQGYKNNYDDIFKFIEKKEFE